MRFRTPDQGEDDCWNEPIETAPVASDQGDPGNQNQQGGYEVGAGVVKQANEACRLGTGARFGVR